MNDKSIDSETVMMTADEILQELMDGNQRYVEKHLTHMHQDTARIYEIAAGQHPIAIILGCSDSRVPPEIIFDQGLGDLFVIRVAGNVVDDAVLGSIEYAIKEFGVVLVMVLGHERCGAVTAAAKHLAVSGHISMLIAAIEPALAQVQYSDPDSIDAAVIANVKLAVEQIKASEPVLSELVQQSQVKVVGARYDLDDGLVKVID
jgi:carbonic anhydrase